MIKLIRFSAILVVVLLSLSYFTANALKAADVGTSQPINWRGFSDSAFQEAKSQHRLVFLYGHALWCPYCRHMDSATLTDSGVIKMLNDHFVAINLDVDKDSAVADKYSINVLPTIIIMDGDKHIVKEITGYTSAESLLGSLEGVVAR